MPINLAYLFEPFPVFFQPYINPIIKYFNSNENYDFKVFALKKVAGESVVDKLEYLTTNYKKRKLIELSNRWLGHNKNYNFFEHKMNKFDIVHIQHSFLFSKFDPILKHEHAKRPKFVITLRGSETYIKPLISKRWEEFFLKDMMDAYVVMSENQKLKLIHYGIDAQKIYLIPISHDFDEFNKENNVRLKKNQIRIVSVFRLCWEKNIFGNLMVIFNIKKMGYNVNYTIYGDGVEKGKLLYLIDYLNLNDEVDYKGKKPKVEVLENLSIFNFYLQLSFSESLGMSVIEAQSQGLPCIVSNVGGLGEIIPNGESGYTVEPFEYEKAANFIVDLYKNETLYYEFSKNSKENSQRYKVSNEIQKLENMYMELLNT